MNIVKDVNNNSFTLMGLPFKAVNATGGIFLNDLVFTGAVMGKQATSVPAPDQIWLWTDQGDGNYDYEQYFFYKVSNDVGDWRTADTKTPFSEMHEDGIPAGTAFWFRRTDAVDPISTTLSGEVSATDREVTIMRGKFQFVSYPFPAKLKLNDSSMFVCSNCTDGKNPTSVPAPDQIWLWADQGDGTWDYEQYFYYRVSTGVYEWRTADDKTPFQEKHPEGLTVGQGFWFSSGENPDASETYTITFKSPIAK